MKTIIGTLTTLIILTLSFQGCAQSKKDIDQIEDVIEGFATGVDQQKGSMISDAFRDGAGFFATNNRDKVLSVTPAQLAELHEAKKFGGRERKLTIKNVDIVDDIVASAKVIAQDDTVHYVYYIALSKLEGTWKIQSILQHSKMLK